MSKYNFLEIAGIKFKIIKRISDRNKKCKINLSIILLLELYSLHMSICFKEGKFLKKKNVWPNILYLLKYLVSFSFLYIKTVTQYFITSE